MEQEGKLKNEDEEREFSSSDSDSATFVYISSLSEAIEYYPPILQDSTDYRELEERYEVEPWQVRIETVGSSEFIISDLNKANNSSSYRFVIFLAVVIFPVAARNSYLGL